MMCTAAMLIPLGDAIAKSAHEFMDVPISFMAWSRFALGALILAPFALSQQVRLAELVRVPVLLRGLAISIAVFLILQGAARAPLADVFGAFFVAPLISFGLAVLFLKERPGMARTLLILMGFLGLLLIVKPIGGITSGMAFALAAGVFYGVFLTANRGLSGQHRAISMLWAQLIIGAIVMFPFVTHFPTDWSLKLVLAVAASATTSAFGNYLIVLAYRRVEASRLAPLVYVQLFGATIYGVLFFGVFPGVLSFAGLCLLFASGLAALALRGRKERPVT